MTTMRIRRIESTDLPERVRWFNHPAVYEKMPLDAPVSLVGSQQWLAKNALDGSRIDLAFYSEPGGAKIQLLAMGGLVSIDYRHGRCELYIAVNPGLTGHGIGSRSVKWMCAYAFARLGLRRVYLYTIATNEGANRFYERLGFSREGTLREHQVHLGRPVDRCVFGLLRDEWIQKNDGKLVEPDDEIVLPNNA